MKKTVLILAALLFPACASAQSNRPPQDPEAAISPANSSMLVKMTSSMSTATSKVGDPVTGVLIDPRPLRGARVEGKITRADNSILNFSFDTIHIDGKTFPIQSRIVSVTSSKGNEGRDDLDNRVRIEGVGSIAFGTASAIDEGAEIRITAWKK
jgi:hypothetical protein